MKGICPWCKKESNRIGQHILNCKAIPKELSKEDVKYQALEFNLGKDKIYLLCQDYQNLSSLPELRDKYNLDFKNILFILQKRNIKLRTMSESQHLISKQKIKKTCLEKYGVENPSQSEKIKRKKEQTFIKHYGVNNIWKTKEYAEFTSNRWASYSPEKKSELIHKWTKSYGSISKLENKVINALNNLKLPIETQFKFKKYFHKYDIHIKDTKILIEVNGDFWHANPYIYKPNDVLNFPNDNKITAKQLWLKESKHINYAIDQKYYVIILWEHDINEHEKNNDLEKYILDNLNPCLFNLYYS